MEFTNPETRNYLFELYTMTKGDIGIKVSMYDVGAAAGMEKSEAGPIAENLIVEGLVELVTLSGGISITHDGLKALDVDVTPTVQGELLKLGGESVLGDDGRRAVEEMVAEIKSGITGSQATYPQLEEIVIDIKTLDTQMLSPKPKTEVIRELLRSLAKSVSDIGLSDTAMRLNQVIKK